MDFAPSVGFSNLDFYFTARSAEVGLITDESLIILLSRECSSLTPSHASACLMDGLRFRSRERELMSPHKEKLALFIDGANLYATAKSLGFDIDYKRLLREFQSRGYLVRAFYYTAVIEDQEYSSIRPLIDWLDYNGYTVVTKATKEFVDQTGRRKVKGNMDIELAVDAMEIAPFVDQMVLFSGDGDFRSLVEAVQRRGVRVIVVSTISTQPPM